MVLTRRQRRELRGVWGGTCNDCFRDLRPDGTWLDTKHGSYVCHECAFLLNEKTPERCEFAQCNEGEKP